jgi:hypothetical protein
MNDLVRYPFGTISKSFYSGLPFGLFMSFPPPSQLDYTIAIVFISYAKLCQYQNFNVFKFSP